MAKTAKQLAKELKEQPDEAEVAEGVLVDEAEKAAPEDYPGDDTAPPLGLGVVHTRLTLHGQPVHVFDIFPLDGETLVHCFVRNDLAPRVLPREVFDDQSGWQHPVSKEGVEDPTGLGDEVQSELSHAQIEDPTLV